MKKLLFLCILVMFSMAKALEIGCDGLTLRFKDDGSLESYSYNDVSVAAPAGYQVFSMIAPERPNEILPVPGTWKAVDGGWRFTASPISLQIDTSAIVEVTNGMLKLKVDMDSKAGEQGVFLRFALPVPSEKLVWWDDLNSGRTANSGGILQNTTKIRGFADLPEFADAPALRIGSYSMNFWSVVSSGDNGLCYAASLDSPVIFRTAYDTVRQEYQIVFDLGFSQHTRIPLHNQVNFVMYSCEGKEPMRAGLNKYLLAFPQYFQNNCPRDGQWMAFTNISSLDNPDEFYFQFHEGTDGIAEDDKLGIYTFSYYEHAGIMGNMPDYKPGVDEWPPYERQYAGAKATLDKKMKKDGVFDASAIKDPDGRYAIRKFSAYAHLITQFNMDTELPYGKMQFERLTPSFFHLAKQNGVLDGLYYDGISGGVNYNAEHFKYVDYPPMWDAANKKPMLFNYFSSVEYARDVYRSFRGKNKYVMLNGAVQDSYFIKPYIDFGGGEIGLTTATKLAAFRTSSPWRTLGTLLKGDFIRGYTHEDIENFMEVCVSKGIYPGFFDYYTSGSGPGGRYWEHVELVERDRMLHRLYQPLCLNLNKCRWQPNRMVSLSPAEPKVIIERFGEIKKDKVWYLTIINESGKSYKGTLSLPQETTEGTLAVDVLNGITLECGKSLPLVLMPGEFKTLQLGTQKVLEAAQWADLDDMAARYISIQPYKAEKDTQVKFWTRYDYGWPAADVFDGRRCLRMDSSRGVTRPRQWAMPYQDKPGKMHLKITYFVDNPAAEQISKDAFKLHARTGLYNKHSRFSEWKNYNFKLPVEESGKWITRDFILEQDKGVKAVLVQPVLYGKNGMTWRIFVSEVSLTDENGKELLLNTKMQEWFEKPDPVQTAEVSKGMKAWSNAIAARDLPSVIGASRGMEGWIRGNKLENAARRELRECLVSERILALLAQLKGGHAFAFTNQMNQMRLTVTGKGKFSCTMETPDGQECKDLGGNVFAYNYDWQDKQQAKVRIGVEYAPGKEIFSDSMLTMEPVILYECKMQYLGIQNGRIKLLANVANHSRGSFEPVVHFKPVRGLALAAVKLTSVPAGKTVSLPIEIALPNDIADGIYDLSGTVHAGKSVKPFYSFSAKAAILPENANLLNNGGFEQDGSWRDNNKNAVFEMKEVYRGKRCMKLSKLNNNTNASVSQGKQLKQKHPVPVYVSFMAKTENVSRSNPSYASLYIDFHMADGTKRYGQVTPLAQGSTDWTLYTNYFRFDVPVSYMSVYMLIQKDGMGTAWFDDVFIAEDPLYKNNIAMSASVSVDSLYSGEYKARTVNDGIMDTDIEWMNESWASKDSREPHWVELEFAEPSELTSVFIYWSMDGGKAKSSRKIVLQAWGNGAWQDCMTYETETPEEESLLKLPAKITTKKIRLWQPKDSGPAQRPGIMWIREIIVRK